MEVLGIVEKELGITPNETATLQQTAYLYVVGNRVVALVTAECIDKAYVMRNHSNRSEEAHRAMLGIHRMWVHSNFRKQGIATCLVDIARSKMVYGITVPVTLLAFSSPTEAGIKFGLSYSRANKDHGNESQLLIYDCGAVTE